jgi:hypothetical protein
MEVGDEPHAPDYTASRMKKESRPGLTSPLTMGTVAGWVVGGKLL